MTDAAAVLGAFRRTVGIDPPGLRAERLHAGFGHENWRVRADGDAGGWLLKIASPLRPRPMKVENNVAAQRLAAAHGVRVPEVVGIGLDPAPLGRPFYVQRWIDGDDAEAALPRMTSDERAAFAAAYGRAVARLHGILGDFFGEGVLPALRVPGWKEWCRARLVALRRMNTDAGVLETSALDAALAECAALVEEIDVDFAPALAHRDLYPRNLVVGPPATASGPPEVALLDFEHARFTDPAWDFAKLEFWNFTPHPDLAAPFFAAYRDVHGWSDAFETRIRLCRGMELLSAFPWFGVECPSEEMLAVARAALATDSRDAVARWAGR